MIRARLFAAGLLLAWWGCAADAPQPVAIDTAHDVCASCRMVISSRTTAAEIVVPGEVPRLYDDLGCLRDDVQRTPAAAGAVVFVADHLSGEWLRLDVAVVTEVPGLGTPLGSGLIAHRSAEARDADPAARGGRPYDTSTLTPGVRP